MKIGIYTAHLVHNYGAQLQAYATVHFLRQINPHCKIELVNVVTSRARFNIRLFVKCLLPQSIIRSIRFNNFHKLMPHSKTLTPRQLFENPIDYDLHITGGDQIWNVSSGMRQYPVYFLPFIKTKPKIALASSFGVSKLPDNVKMDVKKYLSLFDSLSVREADGVKILKEIGLEAYQILDPTFWIEENNWEKLAGNKPLIKGDYIVAYGFETSSDKPQFLIDAMIKAYNMPVVGFDSARKFHYSKTYDDGGPKEFLNIFKYAKAVITGSFHGTAFSIIFRKNFYVLPHSARNSRMESLLRLFNLSDRILTDEISLSIRNSIDYSKINNCIANAQENTRNYINIILQKYNL